MIMPRYYKVKSSLDKSSTQKPNSEWHIFKVNVCAIFDTHRYKCRMPQSYTREEIIVLNHICMLTWLVHLCKCLSIRYVPDENRLDIQKLSNVFGIADDILIVGYDDNGTDHGRTIWRVLQLYRKENLKLSKDRWYLRCTESPS